MREKTDAAADGKRTRAGIALVAWSVIFYTVIICYCIFSGKYGKSDAENMGTVAITCAVIIPLMALAYGVMAGIMGKKGWLICIADAAFSSALVCCLYNFDEIYGRLSVCAFVAFSVFSFTGLVKSFTELFINFSKRRKKS